MSRFRDPDSKDRQSNAAAAKKAMLEKFWTAAGDPAIAERRAALEAERVIRPGAERDAAKIKHDADRAEQVARAAEFVANAKREAEEAEALAAAEMAVREAALKAEQKAARDIRYAARKAAKKERRRGY